jgi:integrase
MDPCQTAGCDVPSSEHPSAMDELVREYLEDRQAAGLSRRSIDNDIRPRLERIFLPWSEQAGVTSLAQLDQRQLNRFSAHLQTTGGPRGPLSPHTVASYVKTTNAFLAWASQRGKGNDARCHRPKVPVREVEILTDAEIKALIKQAGPRDALILQTLAEAGLRVGELVGMQAGDLLERDVVLLNGHRERQMVNPSDRQGRPRTSHTHPVRPPQEAAVPCAEPANRWRQRSTMAVSTAKSTHRPV